MDDQGGRARRLHGVGKGEQSGSRLLLVDPDAALDRDRNIGGGGHRRDAFGDKFGLAHEAGAEAAALTRSDGQPQLRLISS